MTDTPNNGGPVFPVLNSQLDPGMSLRDWFAGRVLAHISPNAADAAWMEQHGAAMAYRIADAMIAERAK